MSNYTVKTENVLRITIEAKNGREIKQSLVTRLDFAMHSIAWHSASALIFYTDSHFLEDISMIVGEYEQEHSDE